MDTDERVKQIFSTRFNLADFDRRFRAHVGVPPAVIAYVSDKYHEDPETMMWMSSWIKLCPTWDDFHAIWGPSVSKLQRSVFSALDRMNSKWAEVDMQERLNVPQNRDPQLRNALLGFDATECIIRRPIRDQEVYYSGKSGCHTIKYEGACRLSDGLLCWFRGGIPGSIHDIILARTGNIARHLAMDEEILADLGYAGLERAIVPFKRAPGRPLTPGQEAFNATHSFARSIIEHFWGRVKTFAGPREVWRHALDMHPLMMNAAVNLTNAWIRMEPLRAQRPAVLDYGLC